VIGSACCEIGCESERSEYEKIREATPCMLKILIEIGAEILARISKIT